MTLQQLTRPLFILTIVALLIAAMSDAIAWRALAETQDNHRTLCNTLQAQSVIYIKTAQLADKAETKADANGKSDHFWLAAGALDRELALNNAALCGVSKGNVKP